MTQLTQQIAGAYIGAHVEWNGNTQCRVIDVVRNKYLHNMKLILTRIPYMKEEDACYLVGQNPAQLGGLLYAELIRGRSELLLDFTRSRHAVTLDIPTIDYLRSRNYDLGYMGIRSLIEAGIAISSLDKTETK